MKIRVNGEDVNIEGSLTVAELLASRGTPTEGVAVALNGAVAPKSAHATTHLAEADVVEIIHAVGGG